MRFGIMIPAAADSWQVVRRAEELGFSRAWFYDTQMLSADPFVAMLGLLQPSAGEVLIDGVPLTTIGPRAYREHVGAVMQEDLLLSGSIADNICFFDPSFDRERMIACA